MATQNAINNTSNPIASTAITIDPGASGDSYIQFDINTTGEWRLGVDDDASDALKLSNGSALGTTDTFIMTAAGERTLPLQPAAYAYNSATDTNVTGNSATYTVIFNTEVFDQNADYNNSTGVFTAPVTGKYFLNFGLCFADLGAANAGSQVDFPASNRSPILMFFGPGPVRDPSNDLCITGSAFVDMDTSDTVSVRVNVTGGAGNTVDVVGDATPSTWCSFILEV